MLSLHRQPYALGCQGRARPGSEVQQRSKCTAAHHVVRLLQRFHPRVNAPQVAQPQAGRRLLNKGGLFGHGVHTAHLQLWAANGKHHARQAAAGAYIEQAGWCRSVCGQARQMALQWPHGSQAIEQVMGEHVLRIAHCREVIDFVPLLQQCQKVEQLRHLLRCKRQTQGCTPRLQRLHQSGGRRGKCVCHGVVAASAVAERGAAAVKP